MNKSLLLVALLLSGCGRSKESESSAKPGSPVPAGAEFVSVVVTQIAASVDVVGTVTSEKSVTLSARISAQVQDVRVSAGDHVAAGQLLLSLDDRDILQRLAAAEAQLKQADREYQRIRGLLEKGATTEQAATAAEASFTAARANVDSVKIMLTYAQVVSPIDGVVTERRMEPGDLVNPGQPLLTVYDPAHMRLEAPVPVRLIPRVQRGQKVDITIDTSARTIDGEVTEIVGEVDPQTRTRKIKVRLAATDALLPGEFGRLRVDEEERPVIMIPAGAVTRSGQLEMVQVEGDGVLHQRLVRTGPRSGELVEILAGLDTGDRILVHPRNGE